jgi:hypothetical protein
MHSQPDRPRRVGGRKVPAGPGPSPAEPALDRPPEMLRQYLEMVRLRARRAASWLESSSHYAHLVNRDGVIPVTARFSVEDLTFLARAREDLLEFTELALRLADLHQPLDDGPGAGPADHDRRCRSCMWRWPCPTFRILDEVLADGPQPG